MNSKTLVAAVALATAVTATSAAAQTQRAADTGALTAVVPTDLATTWDMLVAELDEGDFNVNATIRESSTIRVLLQSETPSTWVNCGRITVNSQHKVFGDRSYNFAAANSVRYMVADETIDELIDVERRTNLKALATINLAPAPQGTRVSVEALYVMKFRTREFGRNIAARRFDASLDFGSAGHAGLTEEIRLGAQMKTVDVACRPTGELERRIVSVLENPRVLTAEAADQLAQTSPSPKFASLPQAAVPAQLRKKRAISSPSIPVPVSKPVVEAPSTAWRIQLGAMRSQSAAFAAWDKLKPANADLLNPLARHVEKVELSKGTYFRLQAGPLANRPAAAALCSELKDRDQECFVVAP